jgi:LPXTG-site transpeptidase (sortase) family protein
VDGDGHLYPLGTPVAIIRIPRIGVNEVVAEGTTPQVLTGGPGHLRESVLPGEAGVCQIFGRAASYGGPFGKIGSLRRGAVIKTIDGLGESTYRVMDVRRPGDVTPRLQAGQGRITLVTASGRHFIPSGVLRVDAELVNPEAETTLLRSVTLMPSEFAMKGDDSVVWQFVLWIEALAVVSIGSTWAWNRWGRAQAVIVGLPCFLVVGFYVSDQVTRLLPNLL